MSSTWYAAFGLLTLLGVVNAVLLVATMRQVGVLHERVKPVAAGDAGGPRPGNVLSWLPLTEVGREAGVGSHFPSTAPLVMFAYVTPGCGVCDEVIPMVHAFAADRDAARLDVALVTDAGLEAATKLAHRRKAAVPLLRYDDLAAQWELPGSPYVFVARRRSTGDLVMLSGGIVNTMEQLESVLDAAEANIVGLSDQGLGPDLPTRNGSEHPVTGAASALAVARREPGTHERAESEASHAQ